MKSRSYGEFLNRVLARRHACVVMGFVFSCRSLKVEDQFLELLALKKGTTQFIDRHQLLRLQALSKQKLSTSTLSLEGSGFALALNLARMRHRTRFVGKIGSDEIALAFREEMRKRRIVPQLKFTNLPTDQSWRLITPDGRQTTLVYPQASIQFKPEDLLDSDFSCSSLFHIEGLTLYKKELVEKAMRKAKAVGSKISVDVGALDENSLEKKWFNLMLDESIDYFFCTEEQAKKLSDSSDALTSCQKLMQKASLVAITQGEKGAYLACNGSLYRIESFSSDRAINEAGVHEYFVLGLLHGLLGNKSPVEFIRLAERLAIELMETPESELDESSWRRLRRARQI